MEYLHYSKSHSVDSFMSDEKIDLGKKFSLSSMHVVTAPKKNIVTLDEFNKTEYVDLLSKLNQIVHNIFKKGSLEAGYTFATLHYTFMNKGGAAEKDVGISILNKLVVTYFQTFNSPYLYSIFVHAYVLRWFRLIVMLDLKSNELLEFLNINMDWRSKSYRTFKFVDKPFRMLPTLNPDNPIIPFISIEDQQMIDDLIKSNKDNPKKAGTDFIKFYHLIVKRVLSGDESLRYILEIQSLIGPKLVIEYDKSQIAEFIEAIGDYYFKINTEFKAILEKVNKELTISKIERIHHRWIGETKFSGIAFSTIIKERKS